MEIFPETADSYDGLGEANLEMGNKEEAIATYSRALEMDPENDCAREILIEFGAISGAELGALVFGQRGESRIIA